MIVDGLIIMCLIDVYHMNLIMYFAIHQEWEVTVCNSWITFIYFVEQGHVSIIQLNHVDSTWFYQILILLSFPAVTTDFTFSFNFFFHKRSQAHVIRGSWWVELDHTSLGVNKYIIFMRYDILQYAWSELA